MLTADFIALSGFYLLILKVCIVKLNLYHFNFRMFGENLIQDFCTVVEGHTQMTDLTFLFQLQSDFKSSCAFVLSHSGSTQGMHQIKVKIFHATGFQLLLEQRTNVFLIFKIVCRKLVSQYVLISGITGGQAFFDGKFALSIDVSVCCVKVIETVSKESIYHLNGLGNIYIFTVHRQPHISEAKIFLNQFKRSAHFGNLLCFSTV